MGRQDLANLANLADLALLIEDGERWWGMGRRLGRDRPVWLAGPAGRFILGALILLRKIRRESRDWTEADEGPLSWQSCVRRQAGSRCGRM